jgi:hypothetical protein
VRVENRLDGTVAIRFGAQYLTITRCEPALKPAALRPGAARPVRPRRRPPGPSPKLREAMDKLFRKPAPPLWAAASIDRTRTTDRLD